MAKSAEKVRSRNYSSKNNNFIRLNTNEKKTFSQSPIKRKGYTTNNSFNNLTTGNNNNKYNNSLNTNTHSNLFKENHLSEDSVELILPTPVPKNVKKIKN